MITLHLKVDLKVKKSEKHNYQATYTNTFKLYTPNIVTTSNYQSTSLGNFEVIGFLNFFSKATLSDFTMYINFTQRNKHKVIDIALEGRVNTDPVNVKNSSHQIKLKAAIFYPENMPLPPDYAITCYFIFLRISFCLTVIGPPGSTRRWK